MVVVQRVWGLAGATLLLIGGLAGLSWVQAVAADCHGPPNHCRSTCPFPVPSGVTPCVYPKNVVIAETGGRQYVATLGGGHTANAAAGAQASPATSGQPMWFTVGQAGSVTFTIGPDSDPATTETTHFSIAVDSVDPGNLDWTSPTTYAFPVQPNGMQTAEFQFVVRGPALREIRFVISVWDEQSQPSAIQMAFLPQVSPAQVPPLEVGLVACLVLGTAWAVRARKA